MKIEIRDADVAQVNNIKIMALRLSIPLSKRKDIQPTNLKSWNIWHNQTLCRIDQNIVSIMMVGTKLGV